MIVALIAPEALLCAAVNQRLDAEILTRKAIKYLPQKLAKPGIFARCFHLITKRAKLEAVSIPKFPYSSINSLTWQVHHEEPTSQLRKHRFSLVHAFYVTMGGFLFDMSGDESPSEPSTNTPCTRHVLTPAAFTYIMEHFPEIIPDISKDSITDRSESSSLSKALLAVQVGWFCADCVSRLAQRLPLSLLEVSTAAHAVCTLLTYCVWWPKPLNIAEGTPMKGEGVREVHALFMCLKEERNTAQEMAIAAGDSKVVTSNGQPERIVLAANALLRTSNAPPPVDPFRNRSEWSPSFASPSRRHLRYARVSVSLSPILYGLVHFLAWNVHFPTPLERKLWHISSALVTFSGLVLVMLVVITNYFQRKYEGTYSNILERLLVGFGELTIPLTYVLASAFLLVESLRQLFFLDPDAYQVAPLSYYWPHFS
jgi:hypothetical protein